MKQKLRDLSLYRAEGFTKHPNRPNQWVRPGLLTQQPGPEDLATDSDPGAADRDNDGEEINVEVSTDDTTCIMCEQPAYDLPDEFHLPSSAVVCSSECLRAYWDDANADFQQDAAWERERWGV